MFFALSKKIATGGGGSDSSRSASTPTVSTIKAAKLKVEPGQMRRTALLIFLPVCISGFTTQTFLIRQGCANSKNIRIPHFVKSGWGDASCENEQILEATSALFYGSGPHGTLSEDDLDSFFPVMRFWAKNSTPGGFSRVEKLLARLEAELEAGNSAPRDMYKCYTVALDMFGKTGNSEKAEGILSRMEERGKKDKSLSPTRATYNAMMRAYTRKGDMKSAVEILHSMESSSDVNPTIVDYNVILAGYAKLGQARHGEELLARMISLCRVQRTDNLAPDLYSYNTIIDAWSRSNEPGKGIRAQEILSTLIERSKAGEVDLTPDAMTFSSALSAMARGGASIEQIEELWAEAEMLGFGSDSYLSSIVLDAYASRNSLGSAEKAEEMLKRLEKGGMATQLTYNTVLKAWKVRGNDEGLAHAESIFDEMKSLGFADAFSYCTMIALHADRGDEKSAERAEALLDDMHKTNLVPTVATLNAVINAWTRCGKVEKADKILLEMEKAYYGGGAEGTTPNVVSYTTLMNGWAKCGGPRAVDKALCTFERMRSMYKSGNDDARPNLVSYVTLINCIVRSDHPRSAEKAEEKLFEMYKDFKSGFIDVLPNTRLVTAVIDSWQKSGEPNAGERAEDLLTWLLGIYEEEGDDSLQPNEYTFNSVISAWARSRKFGKAARAKGVLNRMIDLNNAGIISASPNTHCYTAVINSCAFCEKDSLEKRQALRIAIETYKELLERVPEGANEVSFSTVVTALRNLLPPDDTRASAIQSIFKKCAEEGHVSDLFLRQVQSSLSEVQLHRLIGPKLLSAEGKVDFEQIPSKWRRNVGRTKTRQTTRVAP